MADLKRLAEGSPSLGAAVRALVDQVQSGNPDSGRTRREASPRQQHEVIGFADTFLFNDEQTRQKG